MIDRLIEGIDNKKTPLCLGIDPKIEKIPPHLIEKYEHLSKYGHARAIYEFCYNIIEKSIDDIAIVKFQSAYFELVPYALEYSLKPLIDYAKSKNLIVIADAKRGDIDRTSNAYARGWLTPANYNVDSMTINPLMGTNCIDYFVEQCLLHDKAIIPTVLTSNESTENYMKRLTEVNQEQKLLLDKIGIDLVDGNYAPLYLLFALAVRKYAEDPRLMGKYGWSNIGAVVGATVAPEIIEPLRLIMPYTKFLMPGIGSSQGGDTRKKIENAITAADENGRGIIIPVSSNITDAHKGAEDARDYAQNAYDRLIHFKEEIHWGLESAGKLPASWKI